MKTVLILTALVLSACVDGNRIFRDGTNGKDGHSVVTEVVQSAPACETDGKTVLFGTDQNDNGVLDADDTNVKTFTVCNGTKGSNGQDATPVTLVKLCSNVTGSYGSTYPEYAFQVGNALYAVYSANGNASMAQLYPGNYSTTAPGANCNFTVGADGVTVTH